MSFIFYLLPSHYPFLLTLANVFFFWSYHTRGCFASIIVHCSTLLSLLLFLANSRIYWKEAGTCIGQVWCRVVWLCLELFLKLTFTPVESIFVLQQILTFLSAYMLKIATWNSYISFLMFNKYPDTIWISYYSSTICCSCLPSSDECQELFA